MINVMLTGAGFTANFGAPLARDIYNYLFNSRVVQDHENIKQLFLKRLNVTNSNYEEIFSKITNMSDVNIKAQFNNQMIEVFEKFVDFYCLNPRMADRKGNKEYHQLLNRLYDKFLNSKNKSILFSLNQDLFVERQYSGLFNKNYPANKFISRLGVNGNVIEDQKEKLAKLIVHVSGDKSIAESNWSTWCQGDLKQVFYIKLHGSLDMRFNDQPLFIAGKEKDSEISKCPLIKFYYEVFSKVLNDNPCRMLIIGYGFQDEHINKKIFKCLENTESELYVVDKKNLNLFLDQFRKDGQKLSLVKKRLKGYFPNGLDSETLVQFTDDNLLNL